MKYFSVSLKNRASCKKFAFAFVRKLFLNHMHSNLICFFFTHHHCTRTHAAMSSVNGAPTSVMTSGAKQAGTVEARYHQYQVVGRLKPSAQKGTRKSTIYKMNVFAPNSVVAKSRFWYYMSMLNRVKKANGEILQINEVTAGSRAARCCIASCPSLSRRAAAAPATRRAVWLRTCLAAHVSGCRCGCACARACSMQRSPWLSQTRCVPVSRPQAPWAVSALVGQAYAVAWGVDAEVVGRGEGNAMQGGGDEWPRIALCTRLC